MTDIQEPSGNGNFNDVRTSLNKQFVDYSKSLREAAEAIDSPLSRWGAVSLSLLLVLVLLADGVFNFFEISDAKFYGVLIGCLIFVVLGQTMTYLSDHSRRWFHEADLEATKARMHYLLELERFDLERRKIHHGILEVPENKSSFTDGTSYPDKGKGGFKQ